MYMYQQTESVEITNSNLQRSFSILLFSCLLSTLPLDGRNLASIFRNWGKVTPSTVLQQHEWILSIPSTFAMRHKMWQLGCTVTSIYTKNKTKPKASPTWSSPRNR